MGKNQENKQAEMLQTLYDHGLVGQSTFLKQILGDAFSAPLKTYLEYSGVMRRKDKPNPEKEPLFE